MATQTMAGAMTRSLKVSCLSFDSVTLLDVCNAIISSLRYVAEADPILGNKKMNSHYSSLTWLFVLTALLSIGCDSGIDSNASPLTEVSAPAPPSSDSGDDSGTTTAAKSAETPKAGKAAMPAMGGMAGMGKMKFPAPADMKFKDNVETNAKVPTDLSELSFVSKDGSLIRLSDYLNKQNVVLVFTEGFNGMLCPFCKTQTSRLVANYKKFQDRNCEVIVVYPGPSERLDDFIKAALKTEKAQVDQVPFPIVLDKAFTATDYFEIHSMHAHPSTYLIDKQGGIQFAYVGKDMTADRPSVKAILDKLDALEK